EMEDCPCLGKTKTVSGQLGSTPDVAADAMPDEGLVIAARRVPSCALRHQKVACAPFGRLYGPAVPNAVRQPRRHGTPDRPRDVDPLRREDDTALDVS